MGRIRTIKPEFFLHDDLFDLEQETGLPCRLAFIGLWTQVDREGRFKWKPRALGAAILPYDNVEFSRVLDALARVQFVTKYVHNGKEYGFIPSFGDHQSINNREAESVLPKPSDGAACEPEEARVDHASSTRHDPAPVEGKGREGKGKEGKELSDASASSCPEPPADPDEKVLMTIPTKSFNLRGEVFRITDTMVAEWQETYELMDVEQELKRAVQWARDNPGKRKTLSGMKRFLGTWLSKRHDRGYPNENTNGHTRGNQHSGRLSAGDRVRAKSAERAAEREREIVPAVDRAG